MGCLFLGIYFSRIYKNRLNQLQDLERLISFLQGEIKYKHSVLSEAFLHASERCRMPFKTWLYELSEALQNNNQENTFIELWEGSMSYLKETSSLMESDFRELRSVGQALLDMDIESQDKALCYEKELIHSRVDELSKGIADKIKISIVLSTLCGILIVVILL